MRAVLLAIAFCLTAAPSFAFDPWAESVVAHEKAAQLGDATGGATVVAKEANSGFGDAFANTSVSALGGVDDAAAALNAIAPAAGETAANDAATIEPAAGTETPVTEDTGEQVELAPGDKENDIVGP